eukprot:Gregarina_sp_Pseudo_9__170@NODE_1111_length_1868_cov_14_726627_g1038_i0_p1_GENE_NODE_1111_length_1868_cov_14_726627_g1038_i0NODE_1111_length_1868_cov_14_726627_g1038_i0_p1_ORF_typecomplete_len293_score2_89_NODE_1111_length_1868_cov_14_726627_g1038_i08391717
MVRLAVRTEVAKISQLAREPTTSTLSSNGSSMSSELLLLRQEDEDKGLITAPKRADVKAPSQSTRAQDDVTSRGSAETSQRDIATVLPTTRARPPVLPKSNCPVPRRSVCRLVNRLSDQGSLAARPTPVIDDLPEEISHRLQRTLIRSSANGPRRSLFAVPPMNEADDEVRQAKYLQRNSLCSSSSMLSTSKSIQVCGPLLGPLLDALLRRTSELQKYRSHPNNTNNGYDPFDSPPPPPPHSPIILPPSYRERMRSAGFTVDEPVPASPSLPVRLQGYDSSGDLLPRLQRAT